MRWSVWLLVAVLAVAGVVAACGGGAPEREVGSQRSVEQEARSQSGASGDDAADGLADTLEADDDRRAAPASAASSSSERPEVVVLDPVAAERAAAEARSSSDAATAGLAGLGVTVWTSDDAIRINVSPTVDSLTVEGPGALRPFSLLLPLQLAVGPWTCAVGVDHSAPDEAEGRFVVTFGDFDESGSEAVVEAAGPEWGGEARLDVVGIVGALTGRHLTATIVSDLKGGMWRISCLRIYE